MTATTSFNSFKKCLATHLRSKGFINVGDILSRKANDTVVILEVQSDRKQSSRDEIVFTINVGISVDALRTADVASICTRGALEGRVRKELLNDAKSG